MGRGLRPGTQEGNSRIFVKKRARVQVARNSTMGFLVLVAGICCFGGIAEGSDISGGWQGVWTKDGDVLPVTVTIAKSGDGYSGTFSSDDLQVSNIPFAEVGDSAGNVHMVLRGDQSTIVFDGAEHGAELEGALTDGPAKGTFSLKRAVLPAADVASRDVTFRNGDISLAGTLSSPLSAGRHPAILFLQGSGPEARFANRWLAEKFTEAGFVSLIYDKRGVGQSTADWQKAGFGELADDAVAGIRFLQGQPKVNPTSVGIYGHSQGGTIAPLVADDAGGLAFIIASAAGGISPADVELYSVENSIGLSALPAKERAEAKTYVATLIDAAYHGRDRAALDALAGRFKERSWYFDPPPPGNSYWTISKQIAGFEPTKYWRQVKSPVLLVYGAKDERIPVKPSIDAIYAALRSGGNSRVTLRILSGVDHTFAIVDRTHKNGWPKHEPDYAKFLTQWAASHIAR